MKDWKFTEAKAKLGEVMDRALDEGPQRIRRRGSAVIIIEEKAYYALTAPRPSFKEFLLSGPSLDGLDLRRDKSLMRDIQLD